MQSVSENQVISKKKKKGLRRNPKAFSGRNNHKFKRFFRPKTAAFSSQKNAVGVQEINRGGGKNENRGEGGNAPHPAWDALGQSLTGG